MMNLNFESWFQFSDMYELIRFMYKYIWQVQKVQPKNKLGNLLDFTFQPFLHFESLETF